MIKRLIVSSLLAISVIGMMPVATLAAWKQDKYKNYYWIENGVKAKGWKNINGEWYYFRNDGAMIAQWLMDNGNWYYFWTNGTMASNCWLKNNGMWYYFDENGKMVTDYVIIGNKRYDFNTLTFIFSQYLDNNNNYMTNSDAAKIVEKATAHNASSNNTSDIEINQSANSTVASSNNN